MQSHCQDHPATQQQFTCSKQPTPIPLARISTKWQFTSISSLLLSHCNGKITYTVVVYMQQPTPIPLARLPTQAVVVYLHQYPTPIPLARLLTQWQFTSCSLLLSDWQDYPHRQWYFISISSLLLSYWQDYPHSGSLPLVLYSYPTGKITHTVVVYLQQPTPIPLARLLTQWQFTSSRLFLSHWQDYIHSGSLPVVPYSYPTGKITHVIGHNSNELCKVA